jgi:hypothetical protein
MNPFRAWLIENPRLRQFVADELLSWNSVPYPLDLNSAHRLAREVAAGEIGKRTHSLIFRLLTVKSWNRGQQA